jgi:two-component system, OmpR family, phosphate regulon sensor histidine kinase PhoR
MSSELLRAFVLILLSILIALPVGKFVAAWAGWAVLCAGLAAQMLFHFGNFSRLERWSRAPEVDDSLEGAGAWDGVFGRLYRHEKDLRSQIAERDDEIRRVIAAIQALTDGVVLLDAHNQIVFCNTTAEQQLGLSLQTDRGQPLVNLIRQPEFGAYLAAEDFSRPLNLRPDRVEDSVLSVFVVPYAAGNRRLLQIKDVTLSNRLDRMRSDFVANVSHELRTPLTVLAGFVETLQEIEVDRETQRQYLQMMAEQSDRMQRIIRDLLTLSSLEAAPPPEDEIVDMAALLDKLRRDAEALSAGRHQVILDVDGQADVRGCEAELVSAFGNLVANAVRYTPNDGTVRLSWRVNEQGGEFAVTDSGIGIEARHLPRLTERFYRVDRGRSRDNGGTGLGLAIVKHSLNRHQARLEITSTPGKGSRFAAVFPAQRLVPVTH